MTKFNKAWLALGAWVAQLIEAIISDPSFNATIADSKVTESEAVRLVVTAVIGVYGVYRIKNVPPPGVPADPNESVAAR